MTSYDSTTVVGLLLTGYVFFTLWCYRHSALFHWRRPSRTNTSVLIAYASNSGNSQQLANELGKTISGSLCLSLNQITADHIQSAQHLLVLASTYGEGEAPDNGRHFLTRLKQWSVSLSQLSYAVLALGDDEYQQFCAYGLQVHQALADSNARPLFNAITVNRMAQQDLSKWYSQLHNTGLTESVSTPQITTANPHVTARLVSRQLVNLGSVGAPLYDIKLQPEQLISWQAGDIVKIFINHEYRQYSIASLATEGHLRLLVREHKKPDGELGLGSGLLCQQANINDELNIQIRNNPSFYSTDFSQPAIFIGNGSGLAGLRSHLVSRIENNQTENWLIFGERCGDSDRPFADELCQWHSSNQLTELDFAFSRQLPKTEKRHAGNYHTGYVSAIIYAQADKISEWVENQAAIFICGNKQGMATDVEQALCDVLGESRLQQLQNQGLYCRDVY